MATKDDALATINAALHLHDRQVRAACVSDVLKHYQDTTAPDVEAFADILRADYPHLIGPIVQEVVEPASSWCPSAHTQVAPEIPSTIDRAASMGITSIGWVDGSNEGAAACEATILGHKVNIEAKLCGYHPGSIHEFNVYVTTEARQPITEKRIKSQTATMAIRECVIELERAPGPPIAATRKEPEPEDTAACGTNLDGELVTLVCSRRFGSPFAQEFAIDATKAGESEVWKGFTLAAKSKDETSHEALERFMQGIREKAGTDIPDSVTVFPKQLRGEDWLPKSKAQENRETTERVAQAEVDFRKRKADEDKCTRSMFVDGRAVVVHAERTSYIRRGKSDYLVGIVGRGLPDTVQADNAEQAIGNWIDDTAALAMRAEIVEKRKAAKLAHDLRETAELTDVFVDGDFERDVPDCDVPAPNNKPEYDASPADVAEYERDGLAQLLPIKTPNNYPPQAGTFGCVYEGGPGPAPSNKGETWAEERARRKVDHARRQKLIADGAKRLDQEVADIASKTSGYHKAVPPKSMDQLRAEQLVEHWDNLEAEQAKRIHALKYKTHPCALCPSIAVFYRDELRQPYALHKRTRLRVNVVAYSALAFALITYATWAYERVRMYSPDNTHTQTSSPTGNGNDKPPTQNSSLPGLKDSPPSLKGSLTSLKGLNTGTSTPGVPNPHPLPIVLLAVTLLGLTSLRSGPYLCNTCRNEVD